MADEHLIPPFRAGPFSVFLGRIVAEQILSSADEIRGDTAPPPMQGPLKRTQLSSISAIMTACVAKRRADVIAARLLRLGRLFAADAAGSRSREDSIARCSESGLAIDPAGRKTEKGPARKGGMRRFIGHFAVAFAAKEVAPRVSLGTMVLAAAFLDVIWPVLVLLGSSAFRIVPGFTANNPFDFSYIPVVAQTC